MGKIVYTTEVPGILALIFAIFQLLWILVLGVTWVLGSLVMIIYEYILKPLWKFIFNPPQKTYGELFNEDTNVIENKRELY